jgi:two-component system KDP operon response regulator KdpE
MESKFTVLIIEDEMPIRRFLRASLTANGYEVLESSAGQEGLLQAASRNPDVIILDLGLPDMDGLAVTRQLREWATMPIIVLSARGKENDKIAALDAGADDYLTKPFGVGELMARMRVALRHSRHHAGDDSPIFAAGDLKIDFARRTVTLGDQPLHLTPIEYKLLTTLAMNAGKVITHQHLLKEVWGPAYAEESHYLRVYMRQLRHKIEREPAQPRYLLTEPGVGYRLVDE